MERPKPLRGRALTAVIMLFTFAVLMVSGVVLYLTPRGRAAHALDWHLLFLDKWEWQNLHTAFGVLFLVSGLLHIWLNRRPLANYLRQRAVGRRSEATPAGVRLELLLAALLCALLLLSAVAEIPPSSYLFDWRNQLKDFWQPSGPPGPR